MTGIVIQSTGTCTDRTLPMRNPLWTPAMLGPVRNFHLDSQAGIVSSGSPPRMDSWTDQAQGRVLTSAAGDKALVNYDFNGKTTPRFSADGYSSAVAIDAASAARGFWLALDLIDASGTQQNLFHTDSFAAYRTSGGSLSVTGYNGNWLPGTLPAGKQIIVVFQETPGTGLARLNGAALGSPRSGVAPSTLSVIRFGRYDPGLIDAAVADFGLLKGAVALADVRKLEGYLAHRYGLTSALPGNHPFKSAPPRKLD